MSKQWLALKAELLKNRNTPILWATFVAFGLAPIMGGVFMLIMRNPELLSKTGGLSIKAQIMDFGANWKAYLGILTQAIGVGGVMVFGFVASWVFGREYSDGTAKDLLALPITRTTILNAKFIVYILWCIALTLCNLIIGFAIGTLLNLPALDPALVAQHLSDYFITTLLTILIGMPVGFFAVWGKGYLAPLGAVALTLVFAQVIAATGYGAYFPWSVPGLYSGAGGEYKAQLNWLSYTIVAGTALAGYVATILYWKHADQVK